MSEPTSPKEKMSRNLTINYESSNVLITNQIFRKVRKYLMSMRYVYFCSFFIVLSLQASMIIFLREQFEFDTLDILKDLGDAGRNLVNSSILAREISLNKMSPFYLDYDEESLKIMIECIANSTVAMRTDVFTNECYLGQRPYKSFEIVINNKNLSYQFAQLTDIFSTFGTNLVNFQNNNDQNALRYLILNGIASAE